MQIDYDSVREDLRFPVFKLAERAAYERECGESPQRLALSGGTNAETVYASPERDREYKASCLRRAAACEAAISILLAS